MTKFATEKERGGGSKRASMYRRDIDHKYVLFTNREPFSSWSGADYNSAQRIRRFPLDDPRLDTLVAKLDQPRRRVAAVVLIVLAHPPPLEKIREGAAPYHPLQADGFQLGVNGLGFGESAAKAVGADDLARIGELQPLRLCSKWGAWWLPSRPGVREASEALTRVQ